MKKLKLGNLEIKVRNNREEILILFIGQEIERVITYKEKNTFKEKTDIVIKENIGKIDSLLRACFFLDMIKNPVIIGDYEDFHKLFQVGDK